MTENLLDIPDFLKRETPAQPTRRTARKKKEKTWNPGIPEKRPTKAQTRILAKRGWTYAQVMKLTRQETVAVIELGAEPEARFSKDKKHQFPDKKDDE